MEKRIERLFVDYLKNTNVPYFETIAKNTYLNFKSNRITARIFQKGSTTRLDDEYITNVIIKSNGTLENVTCRTLEGKLWLIQHKVIVERDFQPLLNKINETENAKMIYHLVGILVSEIDIIQLNGVYDKIIALIKTRLSYIIDRRFEIEETVLEIDDSMINYNKIEKLLEVEISLIIGLRHPCLLWESRFFMIEL